jgi:hypothetical protein
VPGPVVDVLEVVAVELDDAERRALALGALMDAPA